MRLQGREGHSTNHLPIAVAVEEREREVAEREAVVGTMGQGQYMGVSDWLNDSYKYIISPICP